MNSYFQKLNTIFGWLAFVIATITYLLTLEPVASFWDCGEFISCAYKLQIPHPPGTPFFMLVNRLFSMLAASPDQVGFWVNVSSGLCSSFTILFMFWSITMIGLRFFAKKPEQENSLSKSAIHLIIGAGLVGALTYTYTDSFWFSAVEAEVYAMSSLLTAIIFWAMLRWERISDESTSNKWLLFIAYMIGLSIGVHPLNLLTIPALSLIYYYRRFANPTVRGGVISFLIGCVVLLFLIGLIPGLPTMAGKVDIFFVNSLGLPFGSGLWFFVILCIAAVVGGILYSIKKGLVNLNTASLGFALVLIGYVSYGIILIRSQYDPPIDENDPENIVSLVSYLNREQYGSRPLITGPRFTDQPIRAEKTSALYRKDETKGKYIIYGYKEEPVYERKMFFPRIYSGYQNHPQLYRMRLGLAEGEEPTMADNLKFFFTYQLGHMYWRYFGWNFIGKESDQEGAGTLWFGSSDIPDNLANNKGRNQYFALPLLLGLFGLFFHLFANRQTFAVLGLLFFLTGIALIIYLNSPPAEPRERDYIYVGSYYVFAMWIGFGVIAMAQQLKKYLPKVSDDLLAYVCTAIGLVVPVILAQQNWDDHDRSNRYVSVESAKNLLNSCPPNAVLFTGGDNDTFPLWYVQEVEGFRTDVRVCNTSLLGMDWYVFQMKKKAYLSEPLPMSLPNEKYLMGTNDVVYFGPISVLGKKENDLVAEQGVDIKKYIDLLKSNDKEIIPYTQNTSGEQTVTVFPSKRMRLAVDKQAALKAGIVPKGLDTVITNEMVWDFPGNSGRFSRETLAMMDIIATNNWQRPICFAPLLSSKDYMGLDPYLIQEGLIYKLIPVRINQPDQRGQTDKYINTELSYNLFTKGIQETIGGKPFTRKIFFTNLDNPKVFYDENTIRTGVNGLRNSMQEIAYQLALEDKKQKAKDLLSLSLKRIPNKSIPYDEYMFYYLPTLYTAGADKEGDELASMLSKNARQVIDYYSKEKPGSREIRTNAIVLQQISSTMEQFKRPEADKYKKLAQQYANYLGN